MNSLINGKAYDFTQVVVQILGSPVPSVSAISYNEEQSKENNYGAGNRPVSRGRGIKTASGSVTLSMNDIEAIRDVVAGGSLLDIEPFDIIVSFMNSQKVVTHVLKNCEFMNDGVEATVEDKDLKKSFDLVISHINYR